MINEGSTRNTSSASCMVRTLIISMLLLLVIGFSGAFWLYRNLPSMAQETFGPPAPGLSTRQLLVYAIELFYYEDDLLSTPISGEEAIEFEIQSGESTASFTQRLEILKVIKNAAAFRTYLLYSGLDTSVQAGIYHFEPGRNSIEIAHILQDATPQEIEFAILAGWRLEEIAASLPDSGLQIDAQEFLTVAYAPDQTGVTFPAGLPVLTSLEGFLLPGVYALDRETNLYELILILLTYFNTEVDEELRQAYLNQGLELQQAVTLASIIQREAIKEDEQPVIASVFYNRLSAGMKLESDPTVQYALGYIPTDDTWWKNPLYLNDLEFESPYNTYIVASLPPGPICNPGIAALNAVAYPSQTVYLYFRAACDESGYHNFSTTYDEHVSYACPES